MEEKIGRNDPCWCGSGKKYKKCHYEFDEKIREIEEQGHEVPTRSMLKTPEQVEKIKESAKINIACLDAIGEAIHEGMKTSEIDRIVYDTTTKMGGIPAPLNYEGYPYSVCTSVNDQVCHGFPSDDVVLQSGDIVNCDCSTILDGYYSDSSRMYCIGDVSPEDRQLVDVTKECMELGLEQVKPWNFMGDMGNAVHEHAHKYGYHVVREFGGHGIGLEFHEDPWVGYTGKPGTEMLLVPGMIFTIEPMINMGGHDIYIDSDNGWEVYTEDGSKSAQWEIQVLVTDTGHEVLCW
ncbi:MAG: methionyl aminopeptidase [Anaerovoracaceae bacterium]|jgi:methionyl aminopeptidase